ncbi:MAG: hypothetical protein JST59_00645 [Actinobacteria bacterium]|nr:hypothetical protein [Actinomycetota bacterium]
MFGLLNNGLFVLGKESSQLCKLPLKYVTPLLRFFELGLHPTEFFHVEYGARSRFDFQFVVCRFQILHRRFELLYLVTELADNHFPGGFLIIQIEQLRSQSVIVFFEFLRLLGSLQQQCLHACQLELSPLQLFPHGLPFKILELAGNQQLEQLSSVALHDRRVFLLAVEVLQLEQLGESFDLQPERINIFGHANNYTRQLMYRR